jgi:hypothetical protein
MVEKLEPRHTCIRLLIREFYGRGIGGQRRQQISKSVHGKKRETTGEYPYPPPFAGKITLYTGS